MILDKNTPRWGGGGGKRVNSAERHSNRQSTTREQALLRERQRRQYVRDQAGSREAGLACERVRTGERAQTVIVREGRESVWNRESDEGEIHTHAITRRIRGQERRRRRVREWEDQRETVGREARDSEREHGKLRECCAFA